MFYTLCFGVLILDTEQKLLFIGLCTEFHSCKKHRSAPECVFSKTLGCTFLAERCVGSKLNFMLEHFHMDLMCEP